MSSERETVLQKIENYETVIREIKEELGKASDPARREKLENRRDKLEETIGTLEKIVLALTPQPAGKKHHLISFIVLHFVFVFFLSIAIL